MSSPQGGGCGYSNCADGPSCPGGSCSFQNCRGPSCKGGNCDFISCHSPACGGGGCRVVDPLSTLRDGYCDGGACKVNGKPFPSRFAGKLSV
ncbi:conserved unknown protein [Ectocarpus siliculosus]|uniref:Uncharacterized protein n=1 Tax=Ectocarpus siliculosus TaxID=2880 RepID=D7G2B2_ECTSI|nr:conserved unknown protein [Ectocarpus siliculosus]|eukprot:CBJ48789.1 conserved unknown protein [Ectocarpus siliculosus]